MQLERNKWWLNQLPKKSWREWLKKKQRKIFGIPEPKIYTSQSHQYRGRHLEHMYREFSALGWNGDSTSSEDKIRSTVEHIMNHIVSNWESAETAYHALDICMRLLKYQILTPLMGTEREFDNADRYGNERNLRNPVVKRCKENDSEEKEHFAFAALVTVWPDGTRMVDPGGFGGVPVLDYPFNPNSAHVILRETMADPNQGEVVRPIFDGTIYHFVKENESVNHEGMPVYSLNKKQSRIV